MNILVCVKQVPDTESIIEIDHTSRWIRESDDIEYRMNRYVDYALEEALLIKESFSDVVIDVISVGLKRTDDTIRRALSKGADNGIHIQYTDNRFYPASQIAALITGYARAKPYDLIFTGVMAEDDCSVWLGL
jgi:electron transfer flavoprotein beta subunit